MPEPLFTPPDPSQRASQPQESLPALINAAMAHLNLVMIHPFRDGNGRMARAVQTLALAQDAILEPTFSSIEEWLGHNTADYFLPERVIDPLHMATLGFRLTRPVYADAALTESRTASRDLASLVAADLLDPHGQTRGRYYSMGSALAALA